MIKLMIDDHLLIPFGCPKWDIEKIRVTGVSTSGTYVASEVPLAHIETKKQKALRLRDIAYVLPGPLPTERDVRRAAFIVCDILKGRCDDRSDFERRFLDLYFDFCWRRAKSGYMDDPKSVFDALLPLPQAHLYLNDPLNDRWSFPPERMVKVDFAFWTGQRILALEIDGASHVGSEQHVVKDRLLKRAGVDVVHFLHSELLKHGKRLIMDLLPGQIVWWHQGASECRRNPLSDLEEDIDW